MSKSLGEQQSFVWGAVRNNHDPQPSSRRWGKLNHYLLQCPTLFLTGSAAMIFSFGGVREC
jgi:hypothetical protein